jgi:hypothetical protein
VLHSVTINIFIMMCSYIGLIRLGFESEAKKFMDTFSRDYMEQFTEEVQALNLLASQDQYIELTSFLTNGSTNSNRRNLPVNAFV